MLAVGREMWSNQASQVQGSKGASSPIPLLCRSVLDVPIYRLDPELPAPSYAHDGDAGADLYARRAVSIPPGGGRALVPTGVKVAIPDGCAGFVVPRSGMALRHGITCLNTPGLIDSGYRGELAVILVNTDPEEAYEVQRGDRIAQLVVQKVETVIFKEVSESELMPAERGQGGFGHTGR
jgi:dUTP pyrophosphatase